MILKKNIDNLRENLQLNNGFWLLFGGTMHFVIFQIQAGFIRVREMSGKFNFFKVRDLSGNFMLCQGK